MDILIRSESVQIPWRECHWGDNATCLQLPHFGECFIVLTNDYLGWRPAHFGGMPGLRWSVPSDYSAIPIDAVRSVQLVDDSMIRFTCNEQFVPGGLLEISVDSKYLPNWLWAIRKLGIPERGIYAGRDPWLLQWKLHLPQIVFYVGSAFVFVLAVGLTFVFQAEHTVQIFFIVATAFLLFMCHLFYLILCIHRSDANPVPGGAARTAEISDRGIGKQEGQR